jgi:thiol-disulfide isomerase/thioredoxin
LQAAASLSIGRIMRTTILLVPLAALALADCREAPPAVPKQAETPSPTTNQAAAPANMLDRSQAGKPAPTAGFLAPDGSPVSLAAFKGKPVLLNLWATWCVPCVTEMPQLDTLAGQNKDLQIVTVSQDSGDKGKKSVPDFFAKKKFANLRPYMDPENKLTDAFTVISLPTTILFDRKGKEVWRVMGPEDWLGKKAAGLIAEAS